MPIHAAGIYTQQGSLNLVDCAVSSYTPTLRALIKTRRDSDVQNIIKLLVVAVSHPNILGEYVCPLQNTGEEVELVQEIIPTVKTLIDDEATVNAVLSAFKECSWVHLACHGVQSRDDPLQSALLLRDGRLHLGDIFKLNLPNADFAFLSACQTAVGDMRLQDEAMHLAAGFLFAGFRSAVATMWSMRDADGPLVSEAVYKQLFMNGTPDRSRTAFALHSAIQVMRKNNIPMFRWVPFIHLGI
jgi:CHAT domain-containing protein